MIGDGSTVSGFAAAGVEGFPAYDSAEALATLRRLAQAGEYAIIFVTEGLAEPVLADIARIPTGSVPAIIVVPDQGGARGIGFRKISSAVEKALGIDLLGKQSANSAAGAAEAAPGGAADAGRESEDGR
jgi:V/A-type H+/Na+-transporting ATPase subunit F